MHRRNLMQLLERYHPIDRGEIVFKNEMLSFIELEKNCFERDTCRNPCPSLGRGPGKHSCFAEFAEQSLPERNLAPLGAGGIQRTLTKGHMTASAWLLNQDGSKALLLHHAKLDRWFQLGGHADGDSDLLQVALKEAMEESGLENIHPISPEIFDIDIHLIPENSKDPAHYHYDVRFLLQATGNNELKSNHESKSLRWIDKNLKNLPTDNPSVVRMFKKWISSSHLRNQSKPL